MKEFIIPIFVKSEQELYSQFDPSGLALDSSLRDYLSDYLEDRGFMEKVSLVLHSPDKPDMDRFKEAYVLFVNRLASRNKKEILKFRTESLRLLLTGIMFITAGIVLNGRLDQVLGVIISTIGSFSVWEASAVWIKMLPSLHRRSMLLKKLSVAEIRYNEE